MRFGDSRLSAMEFGGGQDWTEPGGRFCGGIRDTPPAAQDKAEWPHIPRGPFCTPSQGHRTWGGMSWPLPCMGASTLVAMKGTVESSAGLTSGWSL